MLRLISSNALWQAAVLPTKAMSHQGKFFYRRRHQVEPLMRMRNLTPVYPAPGYNLELPDWTPELFLKRIGGGCAEYADKFETLDEVFKLDRLELKEKGVPTVQRKYIFRIRELLRRGVLSFEYLSRRTVYTLPEKKTK